MYNLNCLCFPLLPRKKIVALTYDSTLVYAMRSAASLHSVTKEPGHNLVLHIKKSVVTTDNLDVIAFPYTNMALSKRETQTKTNIYTVYISG